MLAYTIERTLTQQVEFERDEQVADRWGAEISRDREANITVPCKAWWQKQSARGPGREEDTSSETVAIGQGQLLVPGGTDVQDTDRIAQITDRAGNVLFAGPLHITAILPHASYPALIEIAFRAPD